MCAPVIMTGSCTDRWNLPSSREAHDAAFGELIMASGHLEKVLATLDEGVVQTFYDVVS
jgi:hypothetical protein